MNTEILTRIATPKPHRKNATEEHIYADNQKARTTAKLLSEISARRSYGEGEGKP